MPVPEIRCPDCSTTMPYTAAACPNCRRRMIGVGLSVRRAAPPREVDYGPTPYVRCRARACAFNVTAKDSNCPGCGASRPHLPPSSYLRAVLLWLGDHPLLFLAAFLGALFFVRSYGVIFVVTMGILTGALILLERERAEAGEEQSSLPSLSGSERRVRERLQEIDRREGQILSVLARAKEGAGEDWREVRPRLDDALSTLRRQKAGYEFKLFEIELVRWQNRLAPFLYGLEEMTAAQCENRLREVEAARGAGAGLRARLTKQAAALGSPPEAAGLLRKVDETLASAAKMHDALLARQAVLTLRELGSLGGAPETHSTEEEALREVEVFNIQVAITDFSSSLEELEAEYARAGGAPGRLAG